MPGCKPLTDAEIANTLRFLHNPRDRCLFLLGIRTGFRISELLSIRVCDVLQHGVIKTHLTVSRGNMKGKHSSRSVKLHIDAIRAIEAWLRVSTLDANDPLFMSRLKRPMCRKQAWNILKQAFNNARIPGMTATHSLRKSFASRVYEASGRDIRKTQAAIGHKSIASTTAYLQVDQAEIDDIVSNIK